ncbi:MAG: XRE family transcriptional regulator [Myxococcales bacterium]|nr:MAG: XRE family transcriptional regulator [Myxococcales bacterium]
MSKLRKLREERLISKSELARKAGISTVTLDRIEKGYKCRVATKRRILEALGLTVRDKDKVFDD